MPTFDAVSQGLIHITIPVGMLQCNCSIIGDPITREALVIDPGDEVTRILELLGRHRADGQSHRQHPRSHRPRRRPQQAAAIHRRSHLDASRRSALFIKEWKCKPPFSASPHRKSTDVDQLLKEGDALNWGSFQANVMHTPGHTPGSVCLYLPKDAGSVAMPAPRLFAGDTLFAGSIGRTDLWGGSMDQITDSLRGKLMQLPDETDRLSRPRPFDEHRPGTQHQSVFDYDIDSIAHAASRLPA